MICYSGDLEKTWAALILASTAAASGTPHQDVPDLLGPADLRQGRQVRVTGQGWMQKMLSLMQRPGISHRKLSKMNFMGMGPWMMGTLAEAVRRRQAEGTPRDQRWRWAWSSCPCQMTMDMFGLKRDDIIDGMGEPVGAATVVGLLSNGAAPLFI